MSAKDRTIWGIHAGRTGDADTLFRTRNCIALGWPQVGDLSKLGATRDAFRVKVRQTYPNARDGAVAGYTGQLYRFVHTMKPGDFVAYPSKRDRMIHLGEVEGDYRYEPKGEPAYPHVRSVK